MPDQLYTRHHDYNSTTELYSFPLNFKVLSTPFDFRMFSVIDILFVVHQMLTIAGFTHGSSRSCGLLTACPTRGEGAAVLPSRLLTARHSSPADARLAPHSRPLASTGTPNWSPGCYRGRTARDTGVR